MAVGKSAVGRVLARRLRRRFIDLDKVIESTQGMRVKEIFSQKGESYFRQCEKQALAEVLCRDNQVIATGGGAILDEENLRLLRRRSILIALTASRERLLARSGSGRNRPLLKGAGREARIEALLRVREKRYARAHLSIDTSDLTVEQVAEKIIEMTDFKG